MSESACAGEGLTRLEIILDLGNLVEDIVDVPKRALQAQGRTSSERLHTLPSMFHGGGG